MIENLLSLSPNLLDLYKAAGPTIREEGMRWYQEANKIALSLTERFLLASCSHAAGVIAVLSPAVQWEVNCRDAESVCAARKGQDVTVSTYGQFKEKALAIRDGDDPIKWINPRTAPKTYAFWKCIKDPDNAAHVVIDRHAIAALLGRHLTDKERGGILKKVGAYQKYSQVYKDAAIEVGILPSQMQAICWIQWRNNHA